MVEDEADERRNAEREDHGNEQVFQADVVIHIDGLAMVGIVVQCIVAHIDVGIGGIRPFLIGELRDDLVLLLLDAVVGESRDALAVGDGDVLAGADRQQEEDAALLVAVAEAVGDIIIFRVVALVGIADVVHHEEVDIHAVAVRGAFGLLLEVGQRVGVKDAALIPHQRGRCPGRQGQGHAEQGRSQKGKQFFAVFHIPVSPSHSSMMRAVSIISGMLMPANHAATLPLSTGRSPMSLPVWPFIAKRKSCSFQRVWSIQTGSRA